MFHVKHPPCARSLKNKGTGEDERVVQEEWEQERRGSAPKLIIFALRAERSL